jgi:hypothetical protein
LQPPADPPAAAAYTVLEKHCARCHQGGRLDRPSPAAAFGNVLRLDELAATPHLVQPGNPDASRLYLTMIRRLMPPDGHGDGADAAKPTADEIAAVRSWIAALPPPQPCRDRRPVTPADHAATLAELRRQAGKDVDRLRFLSLAHLHNGCATRHALATYRQAIVRVVNSLSWKTAPVAVPPVDPAQTLFKIDLDDLGWLPGHWERIMQSGTDPLGLTAPPPGDLRQAYGSEYLVVRADWFARAVLSAPLYDQVLGLPATERELFALLGAAGEPSGTATSATVAPPWHAEQPGVVVRRPSLIGPVWQLFHWRPASERPQIDPEAIPAIAQLSPPYAAVRTRFTLPNGLPGFFTTDRQGHRIETPPPGLPDCPACARTGLEEVGTLASDAVTAVLAADRKAASGAMRRIGIDPELTLDGVAPVAALVRAFTHPVDGTRAAAELGVGLDRLRTLADGSSDPAAILARRLVQGLVGRAEIEARAGELIAALELPQAAAVRERAGKRPRPPAEHAAGPTHLDAGLVLYSDKSRYRQGDSLRLVVEPARDCHLTIVSVDTSGRGTVLFPSDFETSDLVPAGRALELPGADSAYAFRLNHKGRETIIALCNEAGGLTDNIRHDFERQRFTDLGDYATFLARTALADTPPPESRPPDTARRRVRRRGAPEAPSRTRARPAEIARTAISIPVE